jgi:signal transduction histidine kinase
VPPLLYAAVLIGGTYYALVDTGPSLRMAGFAGLLLLLLLADTLLAGTLEEHLPASASLALRIVLFAAVNVLDVSGVSRVLFVLVPFTAYFAFGRRAGIALGAGCTVALTAAVALAVPDWYLRAEYISDLVMFTLGVVLALTMAAVASGEREARVRLEGTLREVEELSAAKERNRMAREIHDSLGHHLTAIGVQLEKAAAFTDIDRDGARRAVSDARWSAGQALDEVRRSVRALDDRDATFPLTSALRDLVDHLDHGRLKVSLDVTGEERPDALAPLTTLYRAAQEGLTNACRHSGATRLRLALSYEETGASLVVSDDGKGFDVRHEGFGLRSMRERVGRLGGHVDVATAPGGTVLSVRVPW